MTTLADITVTLAQTQATRNYASNCAALSIAPSNDEFAGEWVLARDGALTLRDADEHWYGGCSVPKQAATAQLKKFVLQGPVGCFLAPPHAAAIRIALNKLAPQQAIIALVPERRAFEILLHCDDFAEAIASHRLLFVAGDDWPRQLAELFETFPGLSIPTQFIRLNTATAEIVEAIVPAAQKIFSEVATRRAHSIRATQESWSPSSRTRRLCIVAPRAFRLWNDWGDLLADAFGDLDCILLDTDDPIHASPSAVAQAASRCEALIAADIARCDAPGVVATAMPWITLVTGGRIPKFDPAGERDQLLLLDANDRSAAFAAGWDETRVHLVHLRRDEMIPRIGNSLSIVADTVSLEPPESIDEFSSHRPLWEYIADELTRNPFAVADDVEAYLDSRLRKFDIAEETLNRPFVIARLIVPAYQQGLVRTLAEARIDAQIFGDGWDESRAIRSREALHDAIADSRALIHVWPDRRVHPIDFVGRPILRAGGTREAFLREARVITSPAPGCVIPAISRLNVDFIRDILRRA